MSVVQITAAVGLGLATSKSWRHLVLIRNSMKINVIRIPLVYSIENKCLLDFVCSASFGVIILIIVSYYCVYKMQNKNNNTTSLIRKLVAKLICLNL